MSRLRVGAGVDCLGIKMCLSTYHFELHVTQVKEPQGVARALPFANNRDFADHTHARAHLNESNLSFCFATFKNHQSVKPTDPL